MCSAAMQPVERERRLLIRAVAIAKERLMPVQLCLDSDAFCLLFQLWMYTLRGFSNDQQHYKQLPSCSYEEIKIFKKSTQPQSTQSSCVFPTQLCIQVSILLVCTQ